MDTWTEDSAETNTYYRYDARHPAGSVVAEWPADIINQPEHIKNAGGGLKKGLNPQKGKV